MNGTAHLALSTLFELSQFARSFCFFLNMYAKEERYMIGDQLKGESPGGRPKSSPPPSRDGQGSQFDRSWQVKISRGDISDGRSMFRNPQPCGKGPPFIGLLCKRIPHRVPTRLFIAVLSISHRSLPHLKLRRASKMHFNIFFKKEQKPSLGKLVIILTMNRGVHSTPRQ